MNIMKFIKIAEKSAHCMRATIDRFDGEYNYNWNYWQMRVWYDNGVIIDIIEVNDLKQMLDVPAGEYEVRYLDDRYKCQKVYDEEAWIDYMIQTDLDNAEAEEDIYYDSMIGWEDIE